MPSSLNQVCKLVASVADRPLHEICGKTEFTTDLEFDAMDCVELIMDVEKEFGVEIKDEEAEYIESVSELASIIDYSLGNISRRPLFLYKARRRTREPVLAGCVKVSANWLGVTGFGLAVASAFGARMNLPIVWVLTFAICALALVSVTSTEACKLLCQRFMKSTSQQSISINVSGGQIGNLNLGKIIGNINTSLKSIEADAGDKVATAIKAVGDSILSSKDLSETSKKDALEQLDGLATEAKAAEPERKQGIAKSLLTSLDSLLATAGRAGEIWLKYKDVFHSLFQIPR